MNSLNSKNKYHFLFTIVFLCFFTYSCEGAFRAYQGQPLPLSEVAIVKGYADFALILGVGASIIAIDGESIGIKNNKIEVKPGLHSINVYAWIISIGGDTDDYRCIIDLNLEGGHEYTIKIHDLWQSEFIIEDSLSNKIVNRIVYQGDCRDLNLYK